MKDENEVASASVLDCFFEKDFGTKSDLGVAYFPIMQIRKDIQNLLNERNNNKLPFNSVLSDTILNYGISDLIRLRSQNIDVMKREIEELLLSFEPRLQILEFDVRKNTGSKTTVNFYVRAILKIDMSQVKLDLILKNTKYFQAGKIL